MSNKVQKAQKALEVLTGARAIIENKSHWIKGAFAKDKRGDHTEPTAPDATKFCSIGVCEKITGKRYSEATEYLENVFDGDIADKNDASRTRHKHVLMAFDFAILMAEDDARKANALK